MGFITVNLCYRKLQEGVCPECGDDDLLWEADDYSNMYKVTCSACGCVFSYNSGCGYARRER